MTPSRQSGSNYKTYQNEMRCVIKNIGHFFAFYQFLTRDYSEPFQVEVCVEV